MADESPEKKPRRRRRKKAEKPAEEIEPTAADVQAEEAAEDVVLEAEEEAGQPEAEQAGQPEAEEADQPEAEEAKEPEAAEAEEPEAPAKPAPSRRRGRERPAGPPPVVRAQAKYVRSSARKARFVCDHIRGKSVDEARAILAHTPRAIARDWNKLLESAVANAENNHELVGEDLYVKAVSADEGPTIRRFRPRAMGRATRIRKRTSHLTILLTPKD
jgi:ribosomal protein L22